ncbi:MULTISPECIES: GNAT family N-acetyltransferase [unclassified Jeotgalibaca]|uniref:GNAT family N-acetyltransferase n=1 Tax=unclassified Jeotgalibaca TaxID=2621505 RepID=UPI003FD26383
MWNTKSFDALTVYELHSIYYLRTQVFVVEQACAYQEVDELDLQSIHLFDKDIHAYARIIPDEDVVHIGRVVVHPEFRKKGLSRKLMTEAIRFCQSSYPGKNIHVQAQAYLQKFYASLGFEPVSEVYLEDNIPHLDMIKKEEKN